MRIEDAIKVINDYDDEFASVLGSGGNLNVSDSVLEDNMFLRRGNRRLDCFRIIYKEGSVH